MGDLWSYLNRLVGRKPAGSGQLEDAAREEVIEFLREWLPASAIVTYRRMILADPENWHRAPHFASGFIVDDVLRGNGITEKTLRVPNLESIWPDLLAAAVLEPTDSEPAATCAHEPDQDHR
ncbi:MAG TPA: hypothetical protein VFI91_02260 [Longimicrobiaceae bacterium]|nr:hypothetical protein [Longimicrobiaceae bacterium]